MNAAVLDNLASKTAALFYSSLKHSLDDAQLFSNPAKDLQSLIQIVFLM